MMTAGSLESVYLKLDRANEHLETLRRAVTELMRGDPNDVNTSSGIDSQFEPYQGRWTLIARVPKTPPTDWGLLIGDCIHNIRSSLDHLAWQLVIANGGNPTRQTSFPIFVDETKFKRWSGGSLKGMNGDAQAIITKLQPFNTWKEDPEDTALWILSELDNIDKHRVLHPTGIWLWTNETRLFLPDGTELQPIQFIERGRLENDTVVARYEWTPILLTPKQAMDMQLELSFDVVIEKGTEVGPKFPKIEGAPIRFVLADLNNIVRNKVLPKFAGCL